MKNLLYLFVIFVLLAGCRKDETKDQPIDPTKDEIEMSDPVVSAIELTGNQLKLIWDHKTELKTVKYTLQLNNHVYENPNKTFLLELKFNTFYQGEITVMYPNGKSTNVKFEFTTGKTKVLFFSTWAGTLYAIDLYSKNIMWQHDSAGYGFNPYLSYDSLLLTGTDQIRAFNIYTGKVEWRILPYSGFSTDFSTVLEGSMLYIRDYGQEKTLAINLSTKETVWQSYYDGTHIINGDHIYVTNSFSAPDLVALDKSTGNLLWGFDLDKNNTSAAEAISSQPVLHGNNLYFGDNIGRIYSVNSINGNKNWSKDLGEFQGSTGAPAFYNNNLIIPVVNKVYSINPTTSDINWINSDNSGNIFSSPFIYKNKIILCSSGNGNGFVFVIDADTGKLIWKIEINGEIHSSPIVYDESIYIGTWDKVYYEINLSDGKITWQYTANDVISNSAVIISGRGEEVIYPNNCGMQ